VRTVRLQVTLRDVDPAVVRVIDVPAAATLPELHDLVQAAFGWWDYHLHQFVTDTATYGMDIPGEEIWPPDQRDESQARLRDLGARFTYLYDFGDGWTHDIEVVGAGGEHPGCVDGEGACPPEDCGGPVGYAQLLETLADPRDEDHQHMREWVGDRLRPFDRAAVDAYVRRMVGAVPASVRLLLDLLAEGARLTATGRLPRAVVRVVQAERPSWHLTGAPAATEDDLRPLADLHQLLRGVGVLRVRHGVLAPTRAGRDDLEVVRRIRSAFAPDAFNTQVVERTVAVLAAHGPQPYQQLGEQVLPELGHGWQRNGQPITAADVQKTIAWQSGLMEGLDLIDTSHPRWAAGPCAQSLLPGATLLSQIWGRSTAAQQ